MKRFSSILAVCAALAASPAFAQSQCDRPPSVTIPDGASATLDQMLDAQSGVREFLSSMETYLECVDDMIESASEETAPETRNAWIEDYNSAVSEMESTAERFNEERVAYQQANPSN